MRPPLGGPCCPADEAMVTKLVMDPQSKPGYEWCAHRECWVHEDVCRNNAYQKGVARCLACRQLPLFDPEEICPVARKKGRRFASGPPEGGALRKRRGPGAGQGNT